MYGQLTDSVDALGYVSYLNKDDFEDGSGMDVIGTDGTVTNSMLKIGFDISDTQRLAFKYDAYRDDGDYGLRPDMGVRFSLARSGQVELFDTNFDRDTISAHYELNLGKTLNLRADLYRNETTFARTPSFGETKYDSSATAENTGLTVMANSVLTTDDFNHELTYGIQWLSVDSKNLHKNLSNPSSVDEQGGEKSDDLAIFAQDVIYFGKGFTLTPGVRYNRYSKESFGNGKEQSWNEWQTALAAQYEFENGFALHASTTGLFKGPQLGEVFIYDPNGKRLNPNLKPETGSNNEFGVKYSAADILGADEFRFAITRFDTTIEDYIDEADYPNDDCTASRGCPRWDVNVGEVEIDGYEASFLYAIDNFDALVTFADSDSKVVHYNEVTNNEPLSREVGDSSTVTLNYFLEQFNVALSWHLQHTSGERIDDDNYKKGYNVHSFSAKWQPQQVEGLSVIFGVDNVFDEFYVSHASRTSSWATKNAQGEDVVYDLADYEPGRNIKMTISYQF